VQASGVPGTVTPANATCTLVAKVRSAVKIKLFFVKITQPLFFDFFATFLL
jgi:hypothetical protein